MSTQSDKLDCVFHLPDQTQHAALAQLFWHKYAGRVFWYGVAQFPETPGALPEGAAGGSVTFDDGRAGQVWFRDGRVGPGGYFEVGFDGLDQLGVQPPRREDPGPGPAAESVPEAGG